MIKTYTLCSNLNYHDPFHAIEIKVYIFLNFYVEIYCLKISIKIKRLIFFLKKQTIKYLILLNIIENKSSVQC